MTSLSHNEPQPMRSPWSFMGSICLHAWVLAWVALGPVLPPPVKSLYEREIEPNENHIFWYKLSDRLPNVTPPEAKRDARPLRARARFDQNMVAVRGIAYVDFQESDPHCLIAPAVHA